MRLDLDVLNPEQREAVEHPGGPLLVLAGAGTGKTRVITYRIAHLMAQQGIQGDRILGITFTNKAAREMRNRLQRMYPDLDPMPVLSTFHGFGLALIRQEHRSCGLRSRFPIYDDSDVRSVLTEIVRHLAGMSQAEARVDDVKGVISRWKSQFLAPERALEASADSFEELCARAFLRYRDRMKGLNAVDFDDLIQLPVLLLEQDEEARKRWSGRYDHLLIDEYQDTNSAQFRLARALVGEQQNLCVVGDDDQSIYRFRGAEVEKILSFRKDFPAAHVVTLERNYRSVGSILEAAHAVISRNPNRHPKKLISQRGPGSPIPFLICDGEMEEASEVVRSIHEARRSGLPLSKQAVLLRSAIQARPFEEKLRFYEIPYTIIGGMSFFDRREVRDVVAYLRCVVFPTDDIALLRILNTPRRGFGGVARERIDEQARSSGRGVQEVLKDPQVLEKISALSRKGARQLVDALDTARAQLAIDGRKALCQLLEDVKYDDQLKAGIEKKRHRWIARFDLALREQARSRKSPGMVAQYHAGAEGRWKRGAGRGVDSDDLSRSQGSRVSAGPSGGSRGGPDPSPESAGGRWRCGRGRGASFDVRGDDPRDGSPDHLDGTAAATIWQGPRV